MRTFVVGDMHGALKALLQCLERCGYNPETDQIIFVGDYVDGWPESAQLVQKLIELDKASTRGNIHIRGNHDKWCEEWLLLGAAHSIWLEQGGRSTLESYVSSGLITEESHKDFFRGLHNYYVDDDNRGFVHGGFHSRKGLGHEVYESDYYWDRDLWQIALLSEGRVHFDDEGVPQSSRFLMHKEVYIGHTSTCNWKCKPHYPEYKDKNQPSLNGPIMIPMRRCNVWNMDTGGGFEGKVTIMDIDTKEYWQSDLVKDLYPGQHGRN